MTNRTMIAALATAVGCATAQGVRAQPQAPADTAKQAVDSAEAQPKKRGMFGKMKSLAHNKTVQSIAKAAACTALPGGQYVVGAINAKQAAKAAIVSGVAATAANAAGAGVAAGAGCIPGMGGGSPGIGGGIPGMGKAGVASALAGAAQMAAMQRAMAVQTQTSNGDVPIETEAPGQQMQVPGDPAKELAKGKLVIEKVDWVRNTAALSASTTQTFTDVMSSVGNAIKANGQRYRVDVYVDKSYTDEEATSVGGQRIAMVMAMLNDRAQVGGSMQSGATKKDKEPRIELVKIK